jgi:hypothetical protein
MADGLPEMTDEDLIEEWETTGATAASIGPGVAPPVHSSELFRRHEAAAEELVRRGFVESMPGYWERPAGDGG